MVSSTPCGPTVVTDTRPLIALMIVPKGTCRIPVSGTKADDPGSSTSTAPEIGVKLPLIASTGGGSAIVWLPRTPELPRGLPDFSASLVDAGVLGASFGGASFGAT